MTNLAFIETIRGHRGSSRRNDEAGSCPAPPPARLPAHGPRDTLGVSRFHRRWKMRRRGLLTGIALVFGALLMAVHPARAQDKPFPIGLRVGETFEACTSGDIVCWKPDRPQTPCGQPPFPG